MSYNCTNINIINFFIVINSGPHDDVDDKMIIIIIIIIREKIIPGFKVLDPQFVQEIIPLPKSLESLKGNIADCLGQSLF